MYFEKFDSGISRQFVGAVVDKAVWSSSIKKTEELV